MSLLKSSTSEGRKDERGLVDIGVIVTVNLVLLLSWEAAKRVLEVAVGILAADHEANLARWVSWDGGVSVLDIWENLLAVCLELGDQWKVEPLVLRYWGLAI